MNRTKMRKQLDRNFSDTQYFYISAFEADTIDLIRISEEFFGHCVKVWNRKYDNKHHQTHHIQLEQLFDIDHNRYVLMAQVVEMPMLDEKYIAKGRMMVQVPLE